MAFPQLTSIQLGDPESTEGYISRCFVPLLENAPALEHISIPASVAMTFKKFETMHKLVPFLKSFEARLLMEGAEPLPKGILPANTMTTFSVPRLLGKRDSPTKLFQYICAKYPNLTHFQFTGYRRDKEPIEDVQQFCELGLYPFLRNVAYKLEEYSININIDGLPDKLPDYTCGVTQFQFRRL
jgi:hypothetical protein